MSRINDRNDIAGRRAGNLAEAVAKTEAPRLRLPPAARRQLILTEAGRLFGEHGYDGVSLDTIAGAANVTKPIIYRHFGSKEDLYLELLEQHRRDMPSFVGELPADAPLEQLIAEVLEGWFAYADERGFSWRMLFRDSGGSEAIQRSRLQMYDDARAVLAGFLAVHPAFAIADEDLQTTAEVIRGGLSSLVLFAQEHPEVTRQSLVGTGTAMIVGLASPSRSTRR